MCFHAITEAVAGGAAASRPTSPIPSTPADVAIEIDEDPPDAADSEPLVCKRTMFILLTVIKCLF